MKNSQGPAIQFCTDFEVVASEGPIKISAVNDDKGTASILAKTVDLRAAKSFLGLGKDIDLVLHALADDPDGRIRLSATNYLVSSELIMHKNGLTVQVGGNIGDATLLVIRKDKVLIGTGLDKEQSTIILEPGKITLKANSIILDGETKIQAGETTFEVTKQGINGKIQATSLDLKSDGVALKSAENNLTVSAANLEAKTQNIKLSAEVGLNLEGVTFTLNSQALSNLKTALNQLQN